MASPARTNNKKRIIVLFALCGIIFTLLSIRLGWIMLVDGEEYSDKAIEQQTKDTPITAKRGQIYDRNKKELAVNAPTYTVWVRPAEVRDKDGDTTEMSVILAEVTGADENEILKSLVKKSALVRIAKNLDTNQAEELRRHMKEGELPVLFVNLIKHCTADSSGTKCVNLN